MIAVNVDCAEKNGECFVFPISDIPSVVKGKEMNKHHGFYILVPQDVFYVLDNPAVEFYSAYLYSRNQVMLKVPSFPYSLLNHRDEIETVVPDIFTAGLDNSRHYFVDGKARREFKYILLNFPAHFELSASEIYGEAGVNESLEMETIKIKFAHARLRDEVVQYWAAWKVARTDIRPDKRGKPDMPGKSKAALALEKILGTSAANVKMGTGT